MAEINDPELREIGAKLANFRRKLGDSIGQKIIQEVFGEMYGHYTPRNIETYEGGKVEIPARLLFHIWKQGNSIDALFAEADVTQTGRNRAKILFEESIFSRLDKMNPVQMERVQEAIGDFKREQIKETDTNSQGTFTAPNKPKRGNIKAGHSKKG